jgi:hypothetical protein
MINDYKCLNCLSISEHWAKAAKIPSSCCEGYVAEKIFSGGKFSLPGTDTAFPTAADKWARRHRKANHHNLKKLGIPC